MRFSPVSYLNSTVQNLPGGLIFYYDFGNPACYPGTGDNIYDLSGNGWHAVKNSGVTYNSANGGYMQFNGVDNVSITGATFNFALTNWTMYCSLYYQAAGSYDGLMVSRRGASNANGIGSFFTARRLDLIANNGLEITAPASPTTQLIPLNAWSLIAGGVQSITYIRQIYQVVTGTTYQNFQSGTKAAGSSTFDFPLCIGEDKESGQNRTINGRIGVSMMWNRQLSQTELTQVNDVFRGRYGI
jgi:hypothetical protein